MKCLICRQGETKVGKTTVTLERDNMTLVIKGVSASICSNCGEEYVDEKTTRQLLNVAEEATKVGVQVDVREYKAA